MHVWWTPNPFLLHQCFLQVLHEKRDDLCSKNGVNGELSKLKGRTSLSL